MNTSNAVASWKLKLAAMLLALVFTGGLVWVAGHFITIRGEALNRKLYLKIWHLRVQYFGRPRIGVTEPDDTIGWHNLPRAVGRHYLPYSFDVRYHIDEYGNRVTRASYDLPKILFLGCSYTFGYGVADDSAYVALLQRQLPGYKLVNTAVNAYGTGQAYLTLLKSLKRYSDIRLVVYPFINHHLHRNYLRKGWMQEIKRQHVHFEVENGRLAYKGLADTDRDAISDSLSLAAKEPEISCSLVEAMADTCRAHGIPFLLIHLPDRRANGLDSLIRPLVDPALYLDLTAYINVDSIRLPMDSHPNPTGHRLMAQYILPFLQKHLSSLPPSKELPGGYGSKEK